MFSQAQQEAKINHLSETAQTLLNSQSQMAENFNHFRASMQPIADAGYSQYSQATGIYTDSIPYATSGNTSGLLPPPSNL